MSFLVLIQWLLVFSTSVSSSDLFPRAFSSRYLNSTTTAESATPTKLCCYVGAHRVAQIHWFTGSLDHTVAIVSTIVYQYNDVATTKYKTVYVNDSLPSTQFGYFDLTISGIPTDIITGGAPYEALTTLVVGNAFTDPYGIVYLSPTPVRYYTQPLSYYTKEAVKTGGVYACPTPNERVIGGTLPPYPSGIYEALPMDAANVTYQGGFPMSPNVISWLISHVPPNPDPVWSNLPLCTPGISEGIPIAHIPVNALTYRPLTTITIESTLYPPTADPVTEPPTNTPSPTPSPTPPIDTPYSPPPPPVNTPYSSPPPPPVDTPYSSPPAPTINTPYPSPPIETPTSPSQPPPNQSPSNPDEYPTNPAGPSNTPPASQLPTLQLTSAVDIPTPTPTVIVINSSTLTPGGTLTIPGVGTSLPTTYILPSSGTGVLIINGVTTTARPISTGPSTSATQQLAEVIVSMGGFGTTSTISSSDSAEGKGSNTITIKSNGNGTAVGGTASPQPTFVETSAGVRWSFEIRNMHGGGLMVPFACFLTLWAL